MIRLTLLTLFLTSTMLTAAADDGGDSTTQSRATVAKDVSSHAAADVCRRISRRLSQNDLQGAAQLMDSQAAEQFFGELLLGHLALAQSAEAEQDEELQTLRNQVRRHGLQSIKVPSMLLLEFDEDEELSEDDLHRLSEAEQESDFDVEYTAACRTAFQQLQQRKDSWSILQDLNRCVCETEGDFNLFSGTIAKHLPGPADQTTLQLEYQDFGYGESDFDEQELELDRDDLPAGASDGLGDYGEQELEDDWVPEEFDVVFLTFRKSDDGWLWTGFDDRRMEEMWEQMEGEPLPPIEDLQVQGTTHDGSTVSLKDLRGKVVLVDFWGTWCGPCVQSLPGLVQIHEAFAPHGLEILGVAADSGDTLTGFFSDHQVLPWNNIVDPEMSIADKYGIHAFPTLLIVDRDGNHVASDLHGVELLDELIRLLELDEVAANAVMAQIPEELLEDSWDGGVAPEDVFQMLDQDGDGQLSLKEFRKIEDLFCDEEFDDDFGPEEELDEDPRG